MLGTHSEQSEQTQNSFVSQEGQMLSELLIPPWILIMLYTTVLTMNR